MINEGQSSGLISPIFTNKIKSEDCEKAFSILQKYKSSKSTLESRTVNNEEWFRLHNWDHKAKPNEEIQPKSGWLVNAILNKHADAMDAIPTADVLPREENDKEEAENLSSILPVILDNNGFENVYSELWFDKLKSGTGVYGIFWDSSKLDGKGDITIECIDILNLFWEPGVKNIQDSQNVFYASLVDNNILLRKYPELKNKLGQSGFVNEYVHDESIDTSAKSLVVDWYYKISENGKDILHYCKFCNNVVLFSTENDEKMSRAGLYDHGKYPFIFDKLYPIKDSICGFGYIDLGRSPQEYIDRIDKAILENTLYGSVPRYFMNKSGTVNEDDFLNFNKHIVYVEGANLGADSVRNIETRSLPGGIFNIKADKVEELKEVTGNRDVSTGGTTSGVTAASAIAAMQESGSKLSRDAIKGSYNAYKEVCLLCIELVRQFYDTVRTFRIIGQEKEMQFINYTNAGIVPQPQGQIDPITGKPQEYGIEVGYRLPIFDVKVTAEKTSPYTKLSQNELALQFYNQGFFNPQMADQALACLEMMDFEGKEQVIKRIEASQSNFVMNMLNSMMTQPVPTNQKPELNSEEESAVTAKARENVRNSTVPN